MRPDGRSMATGTSAGAPNRWSRRRRAAQPSAVCGTSFCQTICPCALMTQIWCAVLAQSHPT